MRKFLLSIIVFASTITKTATAQYWSAVGKGIGPLYTNDVCGIYGTCDGYSAPLTGPPIASMCIYNGDLYAAGFFDYLTDPNEPVNNIAKWNGISWSTVGSGVYTVGGGGYDSWINALIVYNGELYAGGTFTDAGGVPANNIAKWNGTKWSAVGEGLGSYGYSVSSLVIYNGELYAGGYFYNSGNNSVHNIAKWDGTKWSALGTGIEVYKDDYFHGSVGTLSVHDGALYAGGYFDSAGSVATKNIAKWNGTNWSGVGAGIDSAVFSIASYNGKLYAGGYFINIKEWNGTEWSSLTPGISGSVYSFVIYNDNLIAGGYFDTSGTAPKNIAKWNGANWSAMGNGISSGVMSLLSHNDVLYAGGDFNTAGNVLANRIAAWREQCNSAPEQPGNIIKWSTACQSSYAVYSVDPVTNAADFTWSLPAGWSGSSSSNRITALVGANGGTISVTANNPCGSSSAQTLQVTSLNIVSLQLDTIKGSKFVCKDSYQTYTVNPIPEATNYFWILPQGWTGNSTTNTINAKVGPTSGIISVRARNSCSESNVQTLNVTISDFTIPTVEIRGNSLVSAGSKQQYSANAVPDIFNYLWTLQGGGNIAGGQNTNSIEVIWNDPGNHILSAKITNNCGISIEKNILITVIKTAINDPFEIKVLPNPSAGEFYLHVKRAQNKKIRIDILNMLGQTVYVNESLIGSNNTQLLGLYKIAPGMYVVRIRIDESVYTRKIVKK